MSILVVVGASFGHGPVRTSYLDEYLPEESYCPSYQDRIIHNKQVQPSIRTNRVQYL